jgi:predicted nucleic acid-binding protein
MILAGDTSGLVAARLDLADAVNVVLAERYETDVVLTLDRRNFRAVRPLNSHTAFPRPSAARSAT